MGYRNKIRVRFLIIILAAAFFIAGSFSSRMLLITQNQDSEWERHEPRLGMTNKIAPGYIFSHCLKGLYDMVQESCVASLLRFMEVETILEYISFSEKLREEVLSGNTAGSDVSQKAQSDKDALLVNLDNSQKSSAGEISRKISEIILVLLILQAQNMRRKMNHVYQEGKKKNYNCSNFMANLKAMISAFIPLLSGCINLTDVKSHDDDEDVQLHEGKKHDWMYDPMQWAGRFTEYFYYSVLDRVASFRPLADLQSPESPLLLPLAHAGFMYRGRGAVECQGCKKSVNVKDFNSPPTERKYHREGCTFVKLEDSDASHDMRKQEDENILPSSSEVPREPSYQEPQTHNNNLPSQPPTIHPPVSALEQTNNTTETPNIDQASSAAAASLPAAAVEQRANQPSSNQDEEMGACGGPVDSVHSSSSSDLDCEAEFVDMSEEFESEQEHRSPQDPEHSCEKNPGHYTYFPVCQLKPEHIPSNVRDPKFYELLVLIGRMTAKVEVRTISKDNPDYVEGKKYKYGTGIIADCSEVQEFPTENGSSGKWGTVKKYLLLNKSKVYIYIETNRHLVFDNTEAGNTFVEFTYDISNHSKIVQARGVSVKHSSILGDCKSILKCRVSDIACLEVLKNMRQKMTALVEEIPQRIKERLMKRIFVISHPHGKEKMMSYGEYVMVKYKMRENGNPKRRFEKINNYTQISNNPGDIRKALLYTADTCKGSSGAVVLSFRKTGAADGEKIVVDLWMHSGVHKSSGLNASVMKALSSEDVANHGKPSSTNSSAVDDQDLEPDSSENPVVSCPVFTVSAPPTHPAYVSYKKRLESYPRPFNHVHTPVDLSDAGFFYAGYADCVRCFQCGLGLRSWKQGDSIYEEHAKNRPDCQFLQMKMRARGTSSLGFQAHTQQNGSNGSQNSGSSCRQANVSVIVQQSQPATTAATNQKNPETSSQRTSEQKCLVQANIMEQTQLTVPPQEITVATASIAGAPSGAADGRDVRSQAVAVLEREQKYLKQLLVCKVCFKNPVKDLFLPCGELVACLECSKLLTHCPSCNKKILATVTTYFS